MRHNENAPKECSGQVDLDKLLRSLRGEWRLRFGEQDDSVHNVIVRLLEVAEKRNISLETLLRGEPGLVRKKVEAERSSIRRRLSRTAVAMSEEMQNSLPAEYVLSESDSAEVIELVSRKARLSSRERWFIYLWCVLGIDDYNALSARMEVGKKELYRLKHEAMRKFRAIPEEVRELLGGYEHPA